MECSHLICVECSSTHWDGKYALRCCNRITFLEEPTCEVLRAMGGAKSEPDESVGEEYLPVVLDRIKETPQKTPSSPSVPKPVLLPKESVHFDAPSFTPVPAL